MPKQVCMCASACACARARKCMFVIPQEGIYFHQDGLPLTQNSPISLHWLAREHKDLPVSIPQL